MIASYSSVVVSMLLRSGDTNQALCVMLFATFLKQKIFVSCSTLVKNQWASAFAHRTAKAIPSAFALRWRIA